LSVGPPLWSSGQSSLLQIRRTRFDSRHYPKKSSGSGTGSIQPREYNWGATWQKRSGSCLENREYGRRDPSRWPRGTLYPQKLAITSPISGGRSVGIVRSRIRPWSLFCLLWFITLSVEQDETVRRCTSEIVAAGRWTTVDESDTSYIKRFPF
jgi:hypothetical protein